MISAWRFDLLLAGAAVLGVMYLLHAVRDHIQREEWTDVGVHLGSAGLGLVLLAFVFDASFRHHQTYSDGTSNIAIGFAVLLVLSTMILVHAHSLVYYLLRGERRSAACCAIAIGMPAVFLMRWFAPILFVSSA